MNAAHIPCKIRNSTIWVRFVAMPHNIDVKMNPATAKRNRRREPILSDSQPAAGMVTAVARI